MAMAVFGLSTNGHNRPSSYSSTSELFQHSVTSAITRSTAKKNRPPPIFISTNPSHINLHRLSEFYAACNHSCHRFPNFDTSGCVQSVDVDKLRIAVSHSSVVVSVFSRIGEKEEEEAFWPKLVPVTPVNGRLVGFGRAVSDVGLTASIYDVMVIPCLRRMGIGRMIVQKIVRILTSRGIYDIAALCSEVDRLFFQACGFGDDILGSTTMMYSRTVLNHTEGCQTVQAGRKLLLLPSPPPPPPPPPPQHYSL